MSPFARFHVRFAGGNKEVPVIVHKEHLLQRFEERFGLTVEEGVQLLRFILEDRRLAIITEKVEPCSKIALLSEKANICIFFMYGTKYDDTEIKISTVYRTGGGRILVDVNDLCYILPSATDKPLRFGKEKKYFEYKKRESKYAK